MGPLLAAAIPPAIAAGASLIGGLLQNKGARSSAREQMAFQERMANTSYRRARADMESAGYSPYLAYGQGGASSPGGAQATVGDVIGPAVSNAMSANRMRSELALVNAQRNKQEVDTDITRAERDRMYAWMGINSSNTIPKDSPLSEEMATVRANRRRADAEASNAEWENSDAYRNMQLLFGGQGYIGGGVKAVGDLIGNLSPISMFRNGTRMIQDLKFKNSLGLPRPEFHKRIRGFGQNR